MHCVWQNRFFFQNLKVQIFVHILMKFFKKSQKFYNIIKIKKTKFCMYTLTFPLIKNNKFVCATYEFLRKLLKITQKLKMAQ